MTQRNTGDDRNAEVYDAPATRQTVTTGASQVRTYDADVQLRNPTDRVRWGPILAGLFAALSTLAGMTVLGLAIGASVFDPNDTAGGFGLGAGIWGAISVLLAFLVGGWLAARTAALPGRSSGILNGAMVWFVAIPLLIYGLGSAIGAIGRTLGNVAATAAETGAAAVGAAGDQAADAAASAAADPANQAAAGDAAAAAQATAQALSQAAQDPQNQQAVADTVADNAWRALLSLGVAAAAAIGGGALGARKDDDDAVTTSVRA